MRSAIRLGLLAIAAAALLCAPARAAEQVLFDFEGVAPLSQVTTSHATIALVPHAGGKALRVSMSRMDPWPGIGLRPFPNAVEPVWDLGRCDWVAVDLRNVGTARATLCLAAYTPGASGEVSQADYATILPGRSATLKMWLRRSVPAGLPPVDQLFHMRGLPGGFYADAGAIDPRAVRRLALFALQPTADLVVDVDDVRAGGDFTYPAWLANGGQGFFPFVDRYGQFAHQSFPGKTTADADLAQDAAAEVLDLAQHPGPQDRDIYGGWRTGPRLRATGFFYPAKLQGKWWLVDPEGALFFSVGLDVVGLGNETPVLGREHYFQDIPAANTPLGIYRGLGWTPSGFYADKVPYLTYDFAAANAHRKYGQGWQPRARARAHTRLKSWGLNTMGAWGDADVALMRRTPYTVALGSRARAVAGLPGHLNDVFDAAFAASVQQAMAGEVGRSAGDPWCLGYFIDNEICWTYDETGVAEGVLRSPYDQPAKHVFVEDLRARYGTIAALNQAWGTSYVSWVAIKGSLTPPDRTRAFADLKAFSEKFAEVYFRTCRAAVKAVAPQNLYLGCRFASANAVAVRAAAAHCDVLTYNYYGRDVTTLVLPAGVDKPLLGGEFHFGALDRGPFHATGVPATGQAGRAEAFETYVKSALRRPEFVGCHWFQYKDQPITGRFDGENANCGFVDITDKPYPEMVAAARRVGSTMYALRYARPWVVSPATSTTARN